MARIAKGTGKPPEDELKRLEARLMEVSKYPSFPRYLRENYAAFARVISRGGPTKWGEIAKWAKEEGLTGGKDLQAASAKRAYEREKQRQGALEKTPQPSPVSKQPAAKPSVPRPQAEDEDDYELPKYQWTPSKPK